MAETIVNFVVGKLLEVAVKEVLLLYGVDKKVETVRRELERIQAFLKDADKKQITDNRQKQWIKEVRDIAYLIEDAIDTFLLKVPPKSAGKKEAMIKRIIQKFKRIIRKSKKLPAVHELVDEISMIRTRLEEIKASRETYGINNLGEGTGAITLPVRPPVIPDKDPDVVGFKKDQDHVVNELLDKTVKRRYVVSIWGVGGLGKTTLAQKVYNSNDVKKQFQLRIWVDISQKFDLIDILGKIAEQLEQSKKEFSLDKLHKSLRGKRYLIVLDDVWTNDLWAQIGEALPNDNNGSRVLLTTRSFDIAKNADPRCDPYKLGLLTNESSKELLLKKTFREPNEIASNDLSDIVDEFIRKCNGLPISLVVLGGLLAKKTLNFNTWRKVLLQTNWKGDVKKILDTSYEELPFALKLCFMYFAAFPEDYKIDAKTLLRMWVAEGFIPEENEITLEETAESFLEDLVQRSMVEVTVRSTDGSIEYCRIHDLLRDLAVQKAKDDNFLVVYSHPNDQQSLSRARRVAIHHLDCDELTMNPNLRTLLYFHNKCLPNFSEQRLLKVVSTGDNKNTTIKLEMFEKLTQLRYLNLTGKLSKKCEKEYWDKVIGAMKFLQTLDINNLYRGDIDHFMEFREELPDCAWNSETLRHIKTPFLNLPPSAKLRNLQTLDLVTINKSWDTELTHLPNLRTLILKLKNCSSKEVTAFLCTLEHLISLSLSYDDSFSGLLDQFVMRGFPFYDHLQSLVLNPSVSSITPAMTIDVRFFPPHLTSLTFSCCKTEQDIMPELGKLRSLRKLVLTSYDPKVGFTRCNITCSAKGFSQLEILHLKYCYKLEYWEIEEGAMPILRELKISCENLKVPQGLRYLTNLQKLVWSRSEKNKEESEEIRNLCKHVPSINLNW